jgi:hypothetical protein
MRHYPTTTQQRAILRRIDEAEAAMLPRGWINDISPRVLVSADRFVVEQKQPTPCDDHDCGQGRHCPLRPAPAGRTLSDAIDDILMLPIIVLAWIFCRGRA